MKEMIKKYKGTLICSVLVMLAGILVGFTMAQGDIWVAAEEDDVKHILSVMDIKKMIPIVDGVYSRVNINPDDTDTDDVKKYKDLLNKEYSFCLKVIDEVIGRANKLYDKQMATGKVVKFCCDFKALEEVADK